MKQQLFFLTITLSLITNCYGQSTTFQKYPLVYGGPGLGLDYGGIGLKLEYMVIKNIGLFGGAGYNFSELGLNGGVSWKIYQVINLLQRLWQCMAITE